MEPLKPVSIVMTCYNRASLVRKTLESIFKQDYPKEVIVVDDGSIDDTKELAKEFPIKYIYLDRPYYCNQSRAMNVGIRAAQYDNIILQSGEVTHQGDVIAPLVQVIEQEPNIWAFARVVSIEGGKEVMDYTSTANPRPFFFLCALKRQNLLDIRGLDEDFDRPGYDDNDLADRLIKGMGLEPVFLDGIVGYHQEHERGVQQDNPMSRLYEQKTAQWERGEINHIRNLDREWGKID